MSEQSDKTKAALVEVCDRLAAQLGEHCDTVQLFVTRHMDDGSTNTMSYEKGVGNFYARQGQVEEWLLVQRTYQRLWAERKDAEGRQND